MKTFTDKIAIISGAGSGLGSAIASAAARRGCRVMLIDRDSGAAESVRLELTDPTRHAAMACDVSDPEQVEATVKAIRRDHGPPAILVNNAGVNAAGWATNIDRPAVEALFAVNLFGALDLTARVLPLMSELPEAHIVNISSMAALGGLPTQSVYGASKAALANYSQALRAELSGTGIGVTTVYPGALRTNLLRTARFDDPEMQRTLVDLGDRFTPPPAAAARAIVRAIRWNRARVVVRPEAHLFDWLTRWSPTIAGWLTSLIARRGRP